MCVYEYIHVCVCVCMCVYMCLCVCVCVCKNQRKQTNKLVKSRLIWNILILYLMKTLKQFLSKDRCIYIYICIYKRPIKDVLIRQQSSVDKWLNGFKYCYFSTIDSQLLLSGISFLDKIGLGVCLPQEQFGTIISVLGLDMTSWLIESGLSDCPSIPVRAKVECFRSRDQLGCQIMDYSTTMIPSSSIMGYLMGGMTSFQRCSRCILQPKPT